MIALLVGLLLTVVGIITYRRLSSDRPADAFMIERAPFTPDELMQHQFTRWERDND